jgi:hypothetical protein
MAHAVSVAAEAHEQQYTLSSFSRQAALPHLALAVLNLCYWQASKSASCTA